MFQDTFFDQIGREKRPFFAQEIAEAEKKAIPPHWHERPQFICSFREPIEVITEHERWLVPASQGVWIPAGIAHQIAGKKPLKGWVLYPKAEKVGALPQTCQVYCVSPLLRELVIRVLAGKDGPDNLFSKKLEGMICLELQRLEPMDLGLAIPVDRRANRLAAYIFDNPGDTTPAVELAKKMGASERTMARLFLKETGMTFNRWRQQKKVYDAIQLLQEGVPVSEAAYQLGYQNPGAFTAMFKREIGKPPSAFALKK